MSKYFSSFKIVGEVADTLLMDAPARKLLVDISDDVPGHEETAFRTHPSRTTFTVFDPALINQIEATISVGDIVEASGTFSQSEYVPHRTSYIDTTFTVQTVKLLKSKTKTHRATPAVFSEPRV